MAAIEFLVSLDACICARNWAETVRIHGRPATELHLWQQCQRGDWMLWFASAVRVERADLQCALKAVVSVPPCRKCRARIDMSEAEVERSAQEHVDAHSRESDRRIRRHVWNRRR